MEGGFVGGIALGYVNSKLKPVKTINEAPFPTINPSFGNPLVGGAALSAVFVDNAEVNLKACDDVIATDTIQSPYSKVSVAPEFAAAIRALG